MADYVSWASYVSPYYYANEGLFVAQWDSVESIECENGVNATDCHYQDGQEVLDFYHYDVSYKTK